MVQVSSHSGVQPPFFSPRRLSSQVLKFPYFSISNFSVWGSISEIFGRKQVLLSVIIVFLTGSILSSRSTSLEMLVAGRTVQGIGGGGLVTMVEVIMTDMVPLAERGGYWSILALVWAIGSVVGKKLPNSFSFLTVGPIVGGAC